MDKNNLKIIFAISKEGYFSGPNGTLPWDLQHTKEDLKYFKEITTRHDNNSVIMGKDTYLSIIKGRHITHLKGRINIIISSTLSQEEYPDVVIVKTINEAIETVKKQNCKEIFVIGGRSIIKETLFHYNPSEVFISTIHDETGYDIDEFSVFQEYNKIVDFLNTNYDIQSSDTIMNHTTIIQKEIFQIKERINPDETSYLNLIKNILENGKERLDRTGTGTKGLFAQPLSFDVSERFPLLTTKRVFWKGVVEELLFFISGNTDTKCLEKKGINIWKGNTSREFLDKRNLFHYREGEYGPSYGYQWRHFGKKYTSLNESKEESENQEENKGVDQLKECIQLIQTDPTSRRILMTAWNPSCLHEIPLPACHYSVQFYVEDNTLSMLVNMRSCDVFLGLPFNIASYALLLCIVAQITGLKPYNLTFMLGDVHIYQNHIEQCKEQLTRQPKTFPILHVNINPEKKKEIDDFVFEDFKLENYNPYPSIKAEMAI